MVLVGAAAGKVATASTSFLLGPALPPTPSAMPNQKSNKGKKNKHANSSGDEQENGALAAAAGAAAGTIGALDAVAAVGGSGPMVAAGGDGSAGRAAAAMGSASDEARNVKAEGKGRGGPGRVGQEELDHFVKRLQKENGRIDFVEGLIMIDMEKMESGHLEQATEIINKYESRFHYLAVDRVFMQKIQRFLTNLQVKIKLEVAKSNFQAQTLNSHLEKLASRIDACAYPNVDKESITSDELYMFAMTVMEELKKRSQYLHCLLGPGFAVLQPEALTQSSTEHSSHSTSFQQDSKAAVMGVEYTSLMTPSKMGKTAFDDAAISVVKHLIGTQRFKRTAEEQQHEKDHLLLVTGNGGRGARGGGDGGGGAGAGGVIATGSAPGDIIPSRTSQSSVTAAAKKSVSSKKLSMAR
uniref:Uncharacterized protein n=1 Tax=Sphaerodactylus townsendi TaxID=933632 RepID=A0ACB8ETY3_9SAUR